jgi:hypothetical protein
MRFYLHNEKKSYNYNTHKKKDCHKIVYNDERKNMKNLFLTTVAVFGLTGAVYAAEVTGSVELEFAQSSDSTYGMTPTLELGFGTAIADGVVGTASITMEDNVISGYAIGTTFGKFGLSVGEQDDLFVGGYEGNTLADPTSADFSVIATVGDAQFLVGLANPETDLGDVENVQGAYTVAMGAKLVVDASVDYNVDTEDYVLGAAVSGYPAGPVDLGATVTYGDIFAYEATVSKGGVTAFVGGDENEFAQEVGVGYETTVGGLTVSTKSVYNLDTDELAPSLTVAMSF